jgi:ribosomal protein L37E
MPEPSIDYSCSHCGASQTYRLVPDIAPDPAASVGPREIPSIDLRCLRCGASQTYKLVPDSVHTAA